jgi:hypothetical protein
MKWHACAADDAGNAYVVDDPDDGLEVTPLVGLKIQKLDRTGAVLWNVELGAIEPEEHVRATRLAPAGSDGVVITAQLEGSVDFGDGVRDGQGGPSSLIARVRADGTLAYTRLFRGSGLAHAAVDATGRVAVMGMTKRFVDPGDGKRWVRRPLEEFTYLALLEAGGSLAWLRVFDGLASDFAFDADSSLFLAGSFGGRPFFFDGPSPVTVLKDNAWLARLDLQGSLVSAYAMQPDYGYPLIALHDDRVTVAQSIPNGGPDNYTDDDVLLLSFPAAR